MHVCPVSVSISNSMIFHFSWCENRIKYQKKRKKTKNKKKCPQESIWDKSTFNSRPFHPLPYFTVFLLPPTTSPRLSLTLKQCINMKMHYSLFFPTPYSVYVAPLTTYFKTSNLLSLRTRTPVYLLPQTLMLLFRYSKQGTTSVDPPLYGHARK